MLLDWLIISRCTPKAMVMLLHWLIIFGRPAEAAYSCAATAARKRKCQAQYEHNEDGEDRAKHHAKENTHSAKRLVTGEPPLVAIGRPSAIFWLHSRCV